VKAKQAYILYIVVPCYNEELVLEETSQQLKSKMDELLTSQVISAKSRVVFIDDRSTDNTWDIIQKLHKADSLFGGIRLSVNRGHQNALLAGLLTVKDEADVVVSMDADMQDDIEAVDKMLEAVDNGADIVYGIRSSRKRDSFFKRSSALGFYRLMSAMGVNSIYNHADYRLMSRRALNELANFKEVNLFLRGIVPLLGFETATVEYERLERKAGESKYSIGKMLDLAIDGITSFSIKPLRLITSLGILISGISLFVVLYTVAVRFLGDTVPGWAFIMISIWFIGGIQMLSLGIVGEYIGKIYNESKARPRYTVEEIL